MYPIKVKIVKRQRYDHFPAKQDAGRTKHQIPGNGSSACIPDPISKFPTAKAHHFSYWAVSVENWLNY
jgi:hypothetical protein